MTSVSTFLLGLLTIAFVVLKLTAVIAWSWWWVLAPIWMPVAPLAAFLVVAVVVGLVKGMPAAVQAVKEAKKAKE